MFFTNFGSRTGTDTADGATPVPPCVDEWGSLKNSPFCVQLGGRHFNVIWNFLRDLVGTNPSWVISGPKVSAPPSVRLSLPNEGPTKAFGDTVKSGRQFYVRGPYGGCARKDPK